MLDAGQFEIQKRLPVKMDEKVYQYWKKTIKMLKDT